MDFKKVKYIENHLDEYFVDTSFDIIKEYMSEYESGRILLHGSDCIVVDPRADKNPDKPLDFGEGFYTTTFPEQAEQWAIRRNRETNGEAGYVSAYLFHPEKLISYIFDGMNIDWLHFVAECRKYGRYTKNEFDLIVGRVADDDVITTINDYIDKKITDDEALEQLKFVDDNDQYAFIKNQACVKGLDFIGWYYAD